MAEILKRTEEYRVETEDNANDFIRAEKERALAGDYELTSYSATHKIKKDDDFYLIKLVKVW